MSVHSGHRQRLKDRFLNESLSNFEPHEVLELLLYFGIPMKDTNPIAHELIRTFGSLSAVLDAPPGKLKEVPGMTENAAILLHALPEICKIYSSGKMKKRADMSSFSKCLQYLKARMGTDNKEGMRLICLDSENCLLSDVELATGTVNKVSIYIRELQEKALLSHAVNIILAHNHPSYNPLPSMDDLRTTKSIINSLSFIDINVYDHIIIAGENHYSFAQNHVLETLRRECPAPFLAQIASVNKRWIMDAGDSLYTKENEEIMLLAEKM